MKISLFNSVLWHNSFMCRCSVPYSPEDGQEHYPASMSNRATLSRISTILAIGIYRCFLFSHCFLHLCNFLLFPLQTHSAQSNLSRFPYMERLLDLQLIGALQGTARTRGVLEVDGKKPVGHAFKKCPAFQQCLKTA